MSVYIYGKLVFNANNNCLLSTKLLLETNCCSCLFIFNLFQSGESLVYRFTVPYSSYGSQTLQQKVRRSQLKLLFNNY